METNETKTEAPALDLTNIDSLVLKGNLETEVEYKNGLRIKLRYVSRAALSRMLNSCLTPKWDPKTRKSTPQLDNDKFVEQFCATTVLGWTGATIRVLSSLMPLDLSKVPNDKLDAEVPFTQSNLVALIKNALDLDEFLQNASTDVANFNIEQRRNELGN